MNLRNVFPVILGSRRKADLYYNKTMNNKLYISMYHYTRDLKNSRYPGIKGLDLPLFERQLQFFKENFNVIRMEDLMDHYETGKPLPSKALLLTFDDGYIDNYTVALPLLKKYGFQGSFYIPAKTFCENKLLDVNKIHFILAVNEKEGNSSILARQIMNLIDQYRDGGTVLPSNEELYEKYAVANRFDDKDTVFCKRVLQTALPESIRNSISSELFEEYVRMPEEVFARELYMNREQIALMRDNGMFIGLHGYDHYWLGNLSKEAMRQDIEKALEVMKDYIDPEKWVLNYPYGSYNDDVINYISSKGCVLAMTSEVRSVDLEKDDRYRLPRLDCNDFPPKSDHYLEY